MKKKLALLVLAAFMSMSMMSGCVSKAKKPPHPPLRKPVRTTFSMYTPLLRMNR